MGASRAPRRGLYADLAERGGITGTVVGNVGVVLFIADARVVAEVGTPADIDDVGILRLSREGGRGHGESDSRTTG